MSELPPLEFRGTWRRYQQMAIKAFERDRDAGRLNTHIVAPPGSGKTLMGVEMVRRMGRRALVLAPNSAVQSQWLASVALFQEDDGAPAARPDARALIACLTYQSLCRLDDPDRAIGDAAKARWARDRAEATGHSPEAVAVDAAAWTGEAERRRERELARVRARIKAEIARGEESDVDLADLFSASVIERLAGLADVGTLVLDECHHLASMWGYVVRAAMARLHSPHVIGLTATPPDRLTADERALYEELLGPVDFTIPTPAVVRDGYLAPFQELAWLTEPLSSEEQWLSEHNERFQELITRLHDPAGNGPPMGLAEWVITRTRHRERTEGDGELSWARFQKRHPALARAGVRFLHEGGLALPPDAPRGEGYRQPPDLEDWIVLLEDYALGCLTADPSQAAANRYEAIGSALGDLGFSLTRQGVRRGASEVDRLLTTSASKPIALAEVLAVEHEARGDSLRALVLTDAEALSRVKPEGDLATVLDLSAGTAPRAVTTIAGDLRTAPLRPLLVSGRGLRCASGDAGHLLAALRDAAGPEAGVTGWRAEEGDELMRLTAAGTAWEARLWVRLATTIFDRGYTQALVGTRAMLGEGWDAPCVNCLVDLTSSTTAVSVRQMRGRSLRLDPDDPEKIASNWDVVCVAPDLARGSADYHRFVRKHLHLFAPCEDGTIEAGPSHVHPGLGPFSPPPAAIFSEINVAMAARATNHELARERWSIGLPYDGTEREVLLVRPVAGGSQAAASSAAPTPPSYPLNQRPLFGLTAAGGLAAGVGAFAGAPVLVATGAIMSPLTLAWAGVRSARARARLPQVAPLDLAAHAVCEAMVDVGDLSTAAAASLSIEPRPSGYLRCRLRTADREESARFAAAMDELLGEVAAPRYLVSRLAARRVAPLSPQRLTRGGYLEHWHAVPAELGRRKERAEAFARAWQRWLGPSRLVFTHRSDQGRDTLAKAAAQSERWEVNRRQTWA